MCWQSLSFGARGLFFPRQSIFSSLFQPLTLLGAALLRALIAPLDI
jgi:hypothetical protein